jgi:adenosylcobyric acid synthase
VAVVRLPGISNFTDVATLARAPDVGVRFVTEAGRLGRPDLIVLPGTRTTARALTWLRETGIAAALIGMAAEADGPFVVGVCGGCQLLGRTIADPAGVESAERHVEGLGLLNLDTRFEARKTLRRVEGEVRAGLAAGCPVIGYEVHHGVSRRGDGTEAWLRVRCQSGGEVIEDGALSANGRVCGTYVHGLFDDARFCRPWWTAYGDGGGSVRYRRKPGSGDVSFYTRGTRGWGRGWPRTST